MNDGHKKLTNLMCFIKYVDIGYKKKKIGK